LEFARADKIQCVFGKVIEEADKELESPENVNALENLAIAVGSFALTILAELKTIGEEKELNS